MYADALVIKGTVGMLQTYPSTQLHQPKAPRGTRYALKRTVAYPVRTRSTVSWARSRYKTIVLVSGPGGVSLGWHMGRMSGRSAEELRFRSPRCRSRSQIPFLIECTSPVWSRMTYDGRGGTIVAKRVEDGCLQCKGGRTSGRS